ncbi:MAG TPA: oligosaccharide flippase family protein [Gemmatimonadales bacterium]|nr:oligosaccharide flippase family protein [Gemmatimonadales bacterium]
MTTTGGQLAGSAGIQQSESQRADAEARQRRGTRQLLIARAVFMVFGYLSSVILARGLGPAEFGVYGVLLATLVWLEMVSYAGIPAAISRLIPHHLAETRDVESSGRFLLLITSATLFIIAWLLAPTIARLFQLQDGARLVRLAVLDIPFAAAYQGYNGILMGNRRFGLLGVSQAILGAAKLIGVTALLLIGMSVEYALIANVAASAAALLFLIVRRPPSGFRPAAGFLRRILVIALPMGAFYAALQILISLDLWSLGSLWHGDAAVLGQYVAALKIAQTLIVIPMVQSGVLLASVSWALASGDRVGARRHVLEASRFALILSAAACAVVGGSAAPLMGLIYSAAFSAGGPFLILQLVAFSCFAFMDAFAHALMAAGRQRTTAAVLVSFIPVVLVANILLIPRLGPMGAAVSLLIGMLGVSLVTGIVTWWEFGCPFALRTVARVAAAAVPVVLLGVWLPVSGPVVLIKMAVLGGLYLLLLKLMGEITAADFSLPQIRAVAHTAAPSE